MRGIIMNEQCSSPKDFLEPFTLGQSCMVSRRFSEFLVLFDHLKEHCKGIVIPKMPEKTYF
jgi:hypothetical protein